MQPAGGAGGLAAGRAVGAAESRPAAQLPASSLGRRSSLGPKRT